VAIAGCNFTPTAFDQAGDFSNYVNGIAPLRATKPPRCSRDVCRICGNLDSACGLTSLDLACVVDEWLGVGIVISVLLR